MTHRLTNHIQVDESLTLTMFVFDYHSVPALVLLGRALKTVLGFVK